jgi:hypothetical protein
MIIAIDLILDSPTVIVSHAVFGAKKYNKPIHPMYL